jgi:two-component system response regulator
MGEYRTILLAEDQPDEAFHIGRALHDLGVLNPVSAVTDDFEAIQYLEGKGKFGDRVVHPFPSLLLLDLKSAFSDGTRILQWLDRNPSVRKQIVVVMLRTSGESAGGQSASSSGVDLVLQKPERFGELQETLRILKTRWFDKEYSSAEA